MTQRSAPAAPTVPAETSWASRRLSGTVSISNSVSNPQTSTVMKKSNYTGLVLGLLMLVTSSCDSFIDINQDPNNPTTPQLNLLLPATQLSIAGNFNGINRDASNVVQHRSSAILTR